MCFYYTAKGRIVQDVQLGITKAPQIFCGAFMYESLYSPGTMALLGQVSLQAPQSKQAPASIT